MQDCRAIYYKQSGFHRVRTGKYLISHWKKICQSYVYQFLHTPADEITNDYGYYFELFKEAILHKVYNVVLDLLTHIIGHPGCPDEFAGKINSAFKRHLAPYVVIDNKFIALATTEQEAVTLSKAFADAEARGFEGAYDHLRKAVDCLNQHDPDFVGCARESIHAVESVVRKLDPKGSKEFKKALSSLKSHIDIHPALEEGMKRLYGYSSAEEGIRHPVIDPPAKVDLAEALFMLGTCASFVSYLISKARDAGLVKF